MSVRLSASMIKDFISCPRKAYYRINKGEEREETYQMAAGSIVHNTLEKHWDNYDKAMEFAEKQIIGYNLKKGVSIVYNSIVSFFENFTYLVHDTDSIETFFKIPYNSEITLVGKLDRVTKEGIVIDWKTGRTVPTDISSDAQFILYEWAYTKLYGEPPKRLFYVALPSAKIVPYERSQALVNEFMDVTIPNVARELEFNLKSNLFLRTGLFGYRICDNCSFTDVCHKGIGL